MSKLSRRIGAAAATLLWAGPLVAQEVRGVVREATTGRPIASAVLLLLDSAGVSHARNITDARGVYRIVTARWMRRMRVVRIGFRPSEVALPSLALPTDVAEIDVTMVALPTMLEPVQVQSQTMCSARKDRVAALSLLEQARAGLLAAVVAQEKLPAEMIRLRAAQHFDDNGEVTRHQVAIDSSKSVAHAFQAVRSAADFVKLGFYDEGVETLYAPDAETLLDDVFRDGYCFMLRDRDAKRPNAIGLGFAPAKTKNGRIDVDGTLWIDTLARRLLQIDYTYLGLSRVLERAHPAGVVRFRSLDNGIAIIDRWNIRLPSVEVDSSQRSMDGRVKQVMVRAQTSGGVVAKAQWPDGFTWNADLATARVHVIDRERHPVARRTLTLDDTEYQGISDTNGIVAIPRLLPGPYVGLMKDSLLEGIGIRLETSLKFVVKDTETVTATLIAPSATEYVADLCRATSRSPNDTTSAWFIARVLDASGKPVEHASWHAWRFRPLRERDANDGSTWADLESSGRTTSSDGLLAYCADGVQAGDRVRVDIQLDRKTPPQSGAIDLTGPITAARLRLAPPPK